MKLAIYFGLVIFSLIVSVFFGHFQMKRTNKFWLSFLIAFITSIVILGLGSIWWFLTEIDGISQGLGVLYYCIVIGINGIINLVVLSIIKGKNKYTLLN